MRMWAFAKRNFKEIMRDPLSLIFCLVFPLFMMGLFKIITASFPAEQIAIATPQFEINRLTPGVAMFSFTFITLFSGMLVAKDRSTSLLARLKTSPMKSTDFFLGYTLPLVVIAFIQVLVVYISGFIFGLSFKGGTFLGMLAVFPSCIIFIAFGLLFGSLFSDKAVGGMSSLLINAAAILGGIFMPLGTEHMEGITITANCLPFANVLEVCSFARSGQGIYFRQFWIPLVIVLGYMVLISGLSIFTFYKKINSDKN